MRKHIYGVYNIESSNFSFDENERERYRPELCYTHSGVAYYQIAATPWQFFWLRLKFWHIRKTVGSKVRIRKIEN